MNIKHQWLLPLSFAVIFGCSEAPKAPEATKSVTESSEDAQAVPKESAAQKVVETATPAKTVVFDCGGKEFKVKFEGEMADVLLGERTVMLSRIKTASGSKFQEVNGSNSLWNNGDETTIEMDGDVYKCTNK